MRFPWLKKTLNYLFKSQIEEQRIAAHNPGNLSCDQLSVHAKTKSHLRGDGVVPSWQDLGSSYGKVIEGFTIWWLSGFVLLADKVGRDCESGLCLGGADEVEKFLITCQRLGCPVFRNLREQTMLYWIVF